MITTAESSAKEERLLKWGVWAFFFLLIFEGALRKWFLPALSAPLLLVRDPIAIILFIMAWRKGIISSNLYIQLMVGVAILSIATALIFGHGNLAVAIFGARINFIFFPFMFVVGAIFSREDVLQMGRVLLIISIPMAVLIALQFYSPQSAWVNLGVGGDTEGAGFDGALGFFRPPATFSFTNGTHLFFGLTGVFVFYFWFYPKEIKKWILIAATVGLLSAIPLSISRSLLMHLGVSLIFAFIAASKNPKYLSRIAMAVVLGIVAIVALSNFKFFQTATKAFSTRFENASSAEGGLGGTLVDRVIMDGYVQPFIDSSNTPFFGLGTGMGTNVGSQLLTGERDFIIAEGEWGRLMGEMGLLMGLIVIALRVVFCLDIGFKAFREIRFNDMLPWMMFSFAILVIPQGQWAQPTALGFSTLIGGLILASFKKEEENEYS